MSLNREEWLTRAKELVDQLLFTKPARRLPDKVMVSCGIPTGGVSVLGQCWSKSQTQDGTIQIFICPSVDDPMMVLGILVHELCHAVVGSAAGHGKEFVTLATAVGLTEGPATSCLPGPQCKEILKPVLEQLGPYPNVALDKSKPKGPSQPKPIKLRSESIDDYTFSVKQSVFEMGAPLDPNGQPMVPVNPVEDEE